VPRAERASRGGNRQSRPSKGPRGRSRLYLLGAVVLSAAILAAWFPASSLFHQRAGLASASTQLSQLQRQDASLKQEKKNLNAAAEIARIAREQYQLVSPGQQAYQVLPPTGSSVTGTPYPGDPGSTSPVAPSASSELPPGGVTTTTTPTTQSSTHSVTSSGGSTHRQGVIQRMLRALEFWH
jgi:cell division protein FtsB